jgi:methionyl-tRNA synthetase
MDVARAGNKYLADHEPWKLIKTDKERTATILHTSLEISAFLSAIMEPFLPHTAIKLREMLNIIMPQWNDSFTGKQMNTDHSLGTVSLLFDKIEDDIVLQQIEKLKRDIPQPEPNNDSIPSSDSLPPFKPATTFDDFTNMDIRVGTILEAERVPKTDKLLKLLIDTGLDKRTVVSGIAVDFKPEEIIGRQVTLLANLEPRKIKGIDSHGMILMTESADGKLIFVSPAENSPNGKTVR